MSNRRYIRDARTGAVVLSDSIAVFEHLSRKTIEDELRLLKQQIHTLKTELDGLKAEINESRMGN